MSRTEINKTTAGYNEKITSHIERNEMTERKTSEKNFIRVKIPQGVRVLTYLHDQKISVSTPCGGHGSCGACLVRSMDGKLKVMNGDRMHLTEEQMKAGWRLVCQAYAYEECEIEIPKNQSK